MTYTSNLYIATIIVLQLGTCDGARKRQSPICMCQWPWLCCDHHWPKQCKWYAYFSMYTVNNIYLCVIDIKQCHSSILHMQSQLWCPFYTVMLSWINLAQKEGYFIRLGSNSRLLGVKRIGDGEALQVSISSIVHFKFRYCYIFILEFFNISLTFALLTFFLLFSATTTRGWSI